MASHLGAQNFRISHIHWKKVLQVMTIALVTLYIYHCIANRQGGFSSRKGEEIAIGRYSDAIGQDEKSPPAAIYHGHDLLTDLVYTYDPSFKNPCWYGTDGLKNRAMHCLPYVFVIGVKKCGTSDLFARLSRHPDFVDPGFKETQFFAVNRFRDKASDDIEEYIKLFDYAAGNIYLSSLNVSPHRRNGSDGQQYKSWSVTGEASPSNLHLNSHWQFLPGNENLSAPRYVILDYIHHFLPKAKMIIIFRDPIERLYSDYYHEYGNLMPGHKPNPEEFHDIVVKGLGMYKDCFARRSVRSCVYDPTFYEETRIQIQLGIYYIFWEELTRVYPRDQILVLQTKDLHKKKRAMATVFDFLGLRTLSAKEWGPILTPKITRSRNTTYTEQGPMLNATFDLLLAFYKSFNIKMMDLTQNADFLYSNRPS